MRHTTKNSEILRKTQVLGVLAGFRHYAQVPLYLFFLGGGGGSQCPGVFPIGFTFNFSKFFLIFLFSIFILSASDTTNYCKERGCIWKTFSVELAHYPPIIIDKPEGTWIIQCYNGETQYCQRCGEERKYRPPCDTTRYVDDKYFELLFK